MEPTIERVSTAQFWVQPDTRKVYRLYKVRVTLNGQTKTFPSEEHANAWLEDRPPKFVALVTP